MEIRPIGPDLADDYFALFDNAFTDNPFWAGCYCAFYDVSTSNEDWDPSDEGFGQQNRAYRAEVVDRGDAHGLLAYRDGRPVGWVNAGPRDRYGNLRHFAEAIEADDPPTGSIMCFVIHPDHRGSQVASSLLAELDDYFRDFGLSQAEAYPRKAPPNDPDFPWTAAYYKGSPSMYERAGYRAHKKYEYFTSVRKPL